MDNVKVNDLTKESALQVLREQKFSPDVATALLFLHPELAESEDERIRKKMIQWLNEYKEGDPLTICDEEIDSWIAYLEKQKKPHYTKRNALFDKCVENCDPEVMKRVSDKIDEMLEKE